MAASAKTLTVENPTLNGDWKIVLPRRARQIKSSLGTKTLPQQQHQSSSWAPSDVEIDIIRESKLIQKLQTCMNKLEVSQFFLTLSNQIQTPEISDCFKRILGSELKMNMVIYGIGSIEYYESPRLQLSLAILLRKKFNWVGEIEVFDPVLSVTETRVLEALGCSVLSINEKGRRLAQNPTLFFMPHCEAELYNNLLQSNWEVGFLNHIALFGNSFETYEQHVSVFKNSKVAESAKHILGARKFTDEFRIQTVSDDYFGAFHDSSWHFFRPVPGSEIID